MDWWAVAATLLAAAALIAVVWQIARFEGTQPSLGWALRIERSGFVTNGRHTATIAFRPVGPIVVHEVEAHEWGAARITEIAERARMDCDSADLEAPVTWPRGEDAYAGFSWLQSSLIRRTPVRHALRVRLSDGQLFRWEWYRIPRPGSRAQGRWREVGDARGRRAFVPELWSSPEGR